MFELGALFSPGHNGARNSTTLPLVATSRITGKGHISSFLAGPFPPQFVTTYITMAHEMGLCVPLSLYLTTPFLFLLISVCLPGILCPFHYLRYSACLLFLSPLLSA